MSNLSILCINFVNKTEGDAWMLNKKGEQKEEKKKKAIGVKKKSKTKMWKREREKKKQTEILSANSRRLSVKRVLKDLIF